MMTVLLDRILGLAGLFLIGAVVTLVDLQSALAIQELHPMLIMLAVLLGLVALLFAVVFVPAPRAVTNLHLVERMAEHRAFRPFLKIYSALRDYRHTPSALLGAVLISMIVQLIAMTYCWNITTNLVPENTDFTRFAAIFPIGILVTAVPIAPGGMGVGHIGFEKLFHLVGLARGADMFNIYILGNLCLSLSGVIPYFLYKREAIGTLVKEVQLEEAELSS
jgi:hypothetical protein